MKSFINKDSSFSDKKNICYQICMYSVNVCIYLIITLKNGVRLFVAANRGSSNLPFVLQFEQ